MDQPNDTQLRDLIIDRIRREGKITFADFMAACLYEPGLGYYTSPGRKVGAEGDFYTSSNVHAVFGRLIARELRQMWLSMGRPAGFQIVEAGAGGGRLAADILDAIPLIDNDFYATLTYRLVEAEPSLVESQRTMLAAHLAKLAWSTPAELAAGTLTFSGCLLSNELLDALPVHLVEMTAEGLQEVYVTAEGESLKELLAPPSTPAVAAYLERLGVPLFLGQRAEVRLAADEWLRSAASTLERGFILTIDYGFLAEELYGAMRTGGTLLCYFQHRTEENPYIRLGRQDITSHVDFTSLMRTGEEAGLENVWFGEQYRFLLAAGIMEEVARLEVEAAGEEERLKHRLALKKLLLPDGGMGDTFKVLIQGKGVAQPALLSMRAWDDGF